MPFTHNGGMHFFLKLPLLLAGLALAGCAPRNTGTPVSSLQLRASFSDAGVVWSQNGRACVARAPAFQAACPQVGQVADVSWHDGEAWAALPAAGLIATLDHAPQTLTVGAVAVLSQQAIYRQDGSALSYAGTPAGGIPGAPSVVVTGGDGLDYALLAGQLVRVSDNRVIDPLGAAYLTATPTGAVGTAEPSLITENGTYRLKNGLLERLDPSGTALASVPHDRSALVGQVGQDVVTISGSGVIRRFTVTLSERPLTP